MRSWIAWKKTARIARIPARSGPVVVEAEEPEDPFVGSLALHNVVLGDYFDNTLEITVSGAVKRHDPFARLRFRIQTGTQVRLGTWANFSGGSFSNLLVFVDGAFDQLFVLASDGAPHDVDITIGGTGLRTVDIIEGPQAGSEPVVLTGGLVQTIHGLDGDGVEMVAPTLPARRLMVLGDSISNGLPHPPQLAWPNMMKLAGFAGGITVRGSNGRSLYLDSATIGIPALAALMSAGVSDSAGLQDFVIVTGTNDWGAAGGATTTALFSTLLAELVDAVHSACPAARIRCVSPLARSDENVPNMYGEVLDDYRAVMSAVAAARPAFCTYHDASAVIVPGTDTDDGVHPNALGAAKMRDFITALVA